MNIDIGLYVVAVFVTAIVLTTLISAGIRQYHYVQFERKRRGGHLAELITKLVMKDSRGRTTSLIVEKKLLQYVLDDLMLRLPFARVQLVNDMIEIKIGDEKWTVPIGGYHKD